MTIYRCEKIFAMDGSSSEELLEPGHEHLVKEAKVSGRENGNDDRENIEVPWTDNDFLNEAR